MYAQKSFIMYAYIYVLTQIKKKWEGFSRLNQMCDTFKTIKKKS